MSVLRQILTGFFGLICAAGLFIGCARMQTYDVMVKNDAGRPITVWLTKSGPPMEPGWRSPEDIEIHGVRKGERVGGVIVAPGQAVSTGPMKGEFPEGVVAQLRVYAGERGIQDLLVVSRGSPDRIDLMLSAGKSSYVVTDPGGKLTAKAQ